MTLKELRNYIKNPQNNDKPIYKIMPSSYHMKQKVFIKNV